MRMRKKKNLDDRLERVSSLIVRRPAEMKGIWNKLSGSRPIHLEIGCGKGRFIREMAEANPDIFYVAIEKSANVLVTAVERTFENNPSNILFICGDALKLNEYFERGEVSRLYLNFSDPWPSNRHRNRRLTSEIFLKIYSNILSPDATLCLKTDNRPLFDFSVSELESLSWETISITYDLHGQHNIDGGAVTEYEEKFSSEGVPICRLEARPPT